MYAWLLMPDYGAMCLKQRFSAALYSASTFFDLIHLVMYIKQFYTNCLAHAAYYIDSNGEALLIDPLRDTDPYIEFAMERGARIRYILETHFHADFVSGHLEMARKTGAIIVYGPGANPDYASLVARDGEVLTLGKVHLKVLHTPGHTLESCCYLLEDEEHKDHCVFTGDTLFVGDVGRPDLLSGNFEKNQLASMLFDSLHDKLMPLADNLIVYPGHGAGSACGKNIGKETFSTIGDQKRTNYALQGQSRDKFIHEVTEGLTAPPAYFFKDAGINVSGYQPLDKVLERGLRPVKIHEALAAQAAGAVILDTRTADEFANGFFPGAINIGLKGEFAVWAGTIIPFGQSILLFTEKGAERESIIRLARIGYDHVVGCLEPLVFEEAKAHIKMLNPAEAISLAEERNSILLDVRRPGETKQKGIKNAVKIPLAELSNHFDVLGRSKNIIVYCAGGYRSMIAASILKAEGFTHVFNVRGGIEQVQRELPLAVEEFS
jgi:hydroxyacylglutathione hydrolase